MKKIILTILISLTLFSCADEFKRQENLKKLFPNCKVEPAAGLIKNNGFSFIVIDSTNQIIAVSFFPFSETKVYNLRNIR